MANNTLEKVKELNEKIKEYKDLVKDKIEQNKEIQKYIKAANQLVDKIDNELKKLQNENFENFEKLSTINIKITTLLEKIYDGEKFLNIKENENPRELRDTLDSIESKKEEIMTQNMLDEREISRLKEEAIKTQEAIKNVEKLQDDLVIKIKACKKKIVEKLDEQKPLLEEIDKINKDILSLSNKITRLKENKN